MARFLAMLQNPPEDPLNYFLKAYLLSNKDAKIYSSMQSYAIDSNQQIELNKIDIRYVKS